jgi:Protoporphyrinogen oxidase
MGGDSHSAVHGIVGRSAPIVVIGAGLAGLAAANELHHLGHDVLVFEGSPSIAGMASSFRDDKGFQYDSGAHFLTNRLTAALGVDNACRDIAYYGESVRLGGATYGYPFGLMLRRPAYLASAAKRRLRRRSDGGPRNAADWFRNTYGDHFTEEVAQPLCEAWSGTAADQLSPEVGDKMNSVLETLYFSLVKRLTKRAVAIGYNSDQRLNSNVWLVYPRGGLSMICETLAKDISPRIETGARVEEILVVNDRVQGVRVNGRTVEASAVISTAPVNILGRLVTGTDRLAPYRQFRYRGLIAVNICLDGRNLLSDVVVWYPKRDVPFFRLTEAPISMPWLAPEGKTVITCDVSASPGDPVWAKDNETLARECLAGLAATIPDVERRYQGAHTLRLATAYPIFHLDYETERLAWKQGTGIEGLISVGRNGEFGHWLMEGVYWRTLAKVRQLVDPWKRAGLIPTTADDWTASAIPPEMVPSGPVHQHSESPA